MTSVEWQMLVGGLFFVALLGAWHLAGILIVKKFHPSSQSYLRVLSTFLGLLLLHVSEIALCAFFLLFVIHLPHAGELAGFEGGLPDALFLAGSTFATLGYTQVDASGPIRLIIMLQSLAGFMLITWSASFAYTIWTESFRD